MINCSNHGESHDVERIELQGPFDELGAKNLLSQISKRIIAGQRKFLLYLPGNSRIGQDYVLVLREILKIVSANDADLVLVQQKQTLQLDRQVYTQIPGLCQFETEPDAYAYLTRQEVLSRRLRM